MKQIFTNLYLGDWEDAESSEELVKCGITHVLTVSQRPLATKFQEGLTVKFIPLLDIASENVIDHVEECNLFVADGVNTGAVLVHCEAGQSRSAAFVIGYAMATMQLSFDEAFFLVRKQKPDVEPNDGFCQQLTLFGDMGWKVNQSNQEYRTLKLQQVAEKISQNSEFSSLSSLLGSSVDTLTGRTYKCKKCRLILFRDQSLLPHNKGEGPASFLKYNKSTSGKSNPDHGSTELCQRSLFIEPVQWMDDSIRVQEGKIFCPKCSTKLGSFNWSGDRCCCGSWITPSFLIQNSKVDISLPVQQLTHVTPSRTVNPNVFKGGMPG